MRRVILLLFLLLPLPALAGAQIYEPLSASVRAALSRTIADQAPPKSSFKSPLEAADWLTEMSQRLAKRLPNQESRLEFLRAVHYEATRAGLDPQMVLGLIQVESGFNKYAISPAGARGLMQVMPFWARVIGDGDAGKLFHMQTNLRFGCSILRHYLHREGGNMYMALGRYNGSRGQPQYPNAVFAAQKRWLMPNETLP